MSESIFGIRGVSPFAAASQGRKQPRDRNAPQNRPADERPDAPDQQPEQPGDRTHKVDVTV